MSEDEQKIAELEAELIRLRAEQAVHSGIVPERPLLPQAVILSKATIPMPEEIKPGEGIPVMHSDVKWRPAKTPLYIRDPERACWGRRSRRGFPRIGG
jgi:hypothetical protein